MTLVRKSRVSVTHQAEGDELLGPTQTRIKKFVEKAKKSQTLHANCEGFHRRRVVNLADLEPLNIFIDCTLSYAERRPYQDEMKTSDVCKIQSKMLEISRCFNTPGEIHFSAVWVYFYEYDNGEMKQTPLFKIFKEKTESAEEIFLDLNLNVYYGWDYYLDYAKLPKSFLCVPRNGTYRFQPDSECLDLIYVIANGERGPCSVASAFSPFCQAIVRPILSTIREIKLLGVRISEKISSFLSYIGENKWDFLGRLLYSVSLSLRLFFPEHCLFINSGLTILEECCMFLNKNESVKHHLPYVKESPTINPTFFSEGQNNMDVSCDGGLNWYSIFCNFARLFESDSWQLNSSLWPSVACKVISLLNIVLQTVNMIMVGLRRKPSAPGVSIGADFPCITTTATSPQSMPTEKEKINGRGNAVAELINNLEEMENVSFKKISDEVYQKVIRSGGNAPSSHCFGVPISEDSLFPGELYVFPMATFERVLKGIRTILNDDIMIKPRNDQVCDVIDNECQVQATLFHVKEDLAFAYVHHKNSDLMDLSPLHE